MRFGIVLIAGILSSGTALAADPQAEVQRRYSRDYDRCMASGDAANGQTMAMMECTGQEIERQDARLNQAYKMVMMRLTAPEKTRLRALERAWIPARDAGCDREAAPERPGSMARIIYQQCILFETTKRTMWLERYRP